MLLFATEEIPGEEEHFFSNQEQKRLSILEIFVGYEILVSKRQENGG
jgi:hypothetical protein